MNTTETKYELLKNIKEAEKRKSILMEKLEKAMLLKDMFPNKPFPVKMQISSIYPHTYKSTQVTFTFNDKTTVIMPAAKVDKRFLPEDLKNKLNKLGV